jgi:hypothetical protein
MNLFKAYVEGLGSKKLAAVLAAVVAVFAAPIAFKYLGIDSASLIEVFVALLTPVLTFVFAQWHIDAKSGGVTTTAYRLTLQAAQATAAIAKDGTVVDTIARAVALALQKEGGPPAPALVPAAVPVPQTPPSP